MLAAYSIAIYIAMCAVLHSSVARALRGPNVMNELDNASDTVHGMQWMGCIRRETNTSEMTWRRVIWQRNGESERGDNGIMNIEWHEQTRDMQLVDVDPVLCLKEAIH